MQELEQLREALASANQLAAAQAQRLRERDLVLSGIRALAVDDEPAVLIERMFVLMREALDFDQAVVLAPLGDRFTCVAATDPGAVGAEWTAGDFFRRVAGGRAAVAPDNSLVPDWQGRPPAAGSAIYIPIDAPGGAGLLALCSPYHGVYSSRDLALVSGLGLLVSQTLRAGQRLRLADQIQRSELERQAAVRANEIKSTFLANMSHEIRTPLNGVVAVADLLGRSTLAPPQREMVAMILDSGRMLERLLNDVLDFSKIEAGHLVVENRPFHLAGELRSVLDLFGAQARSKGLAFDVAFGVGADGWFEGDAVRVRQVVANLLSNAVKFTTRGSITVAIEAEREGVTIRVRDTGCGFSQDMAERLFERFEQADGSITREFGGTGLGLAICRSLATTMGGAIACRSAPERGAEFEFRFAATALAGPAPEPVAEPEDWPALVAVARILVAEDNPNNRRIIAMILEQCCASITFAEDGRQALTLFGSQPFDIVLMDLQMPVMDGLSAIRAIRALEAERAVAPTPIVALSANAMTHQVAEARDAGADAHVAKPIDPSVLLAEIADLDQRRQGAPGQGGGATARRDLKAS